MPYGSYLQNKSFPELIFSPGKKETKNPDKLRVSRLQEKAPLNRRSGRQRDQEGSLRSILNIKLSSLSWSL